MFSPTTYFFVKEEGKEDFSGEKKAKKRNFKRKEEKEMEWDIRGSDLLRNQ